MITNNLISIRGNNLLQIHMFTLFNLRIGLIKYWEDLLKIDGWKIMLCFNMNLEMSVLHDYPKIHMCIVYSRDIIRFK